jgi:hypothetical protein
MGVFSCTITFDFDLDLDWEMGEDGILVDLIWSFDLVDLATTFELPLTLGLSFRLVADLALVLESGLTVVVVLFDLVVWVFTGVRSSGSISIFIEESAGEKGILIPIASTISVSSAQQHREGTYQISMVLLVHLSPIL